jgi:UMF1 family MFS transporter
MLNRKNKLSKKSIGSWMMFDWASQPFHTLIMTFIFAPYFTNTVAENGVIGQSYWGYALGIAGLLIAILSPILGSLADTTGPRKPWIFAFVCIGAISIFSLWFMVPNSPTSTLIWGLIAFSIGLICFEFAAVFNNAMMPDLVPREELGRLSGNSWALGYIGGLISLVFMLGFMVSNPETGITLLGFSPVLGLDPATHEGDRASGPLTAIWMIIFVIPLFLFTPDQKRKDKVSGSVQKSLRSLWHSIKGLPKKPSLLAFLTSSMLYRDALNGLYAFGGIYAAGVMHWSIVYIGVFGIIANITGAIGAWIGGRVDSLVGSKTVVTSCILLLIVASVLIVSTDQRHIFWIEVASETSPSNLPDVLFFICGGLIGAAGGALQASSRTLMVDQADPDKMTEAFGLYALSGRATSFIAPLAIAFMTAAFASQRIGITPVIVLFVISLALLPKVQSRLS